MGVKADFIDYLTVKRRYSQRTVKLYGDAVEDFQNYFFPDSKISDEELLSAFKFQPIRGYVASLMDRGLDPRTVNLHLSALSTFCNYLVKQKKLQSNPVKEIVRPKEKKRLPSFFSPEVLKLYFDTPVADDYQSVRNRMIVTLLYDTGLRRAEAASLRIRDIDLSRGTITIIGKGNKQRSVPIVESLKEKIGDYLLLRDGFLKDRQSDSFFLTDAGGSAYPEFINRTVKSCDDSGSKGLGYITDS